VKNPGPLLASGRDADIFEYGQGMVLRRSRAGRPLAKEARIMGYLHGQGYPVPAVEELSTDGLELAMERVEGRSMGQVLARAPWTIRHQAKVLADLHRRLHAISPPEFLDPAPIGHGHCIVHLDLHPLNVIIGPKGPVVIDWTNAARGDPITDVALVWALVCAGEMPDNRVEAKLHRWGRSLLMDTFLKSFDREQVARQLREVVTWKARDAHMSQREIEGMWALVEETR